jgi:hypothetical protein
MNVTRGGHVTFSNLHEPLIAQLTKYVCKDRSVRGGRREENKETEEMESMKTSGIWFFDNLTPRSTIYQHPIPTGSSLIPNHFNVLTKPMQTLKSIIKKLNSVA